MRDTGGVVEDVSASTSQCTQDDARGADAELKSWKKSPTETASCSTCSPETSTTPTPSVTSQSATSRSSRVLDCSDVEETASERRSSCGDVPAGVCPSHETLCTSNARTSTTAEWEVLESPSVNAPSGTESGKESISCNSSSLEIASLSSTQDRSLESTSTIDRHHHDSRASLEITHSHASTPETGLNETKKTAARSTPQISSNTALSTSTSDTVHEKPSSKPSGSSSHTSSTFATVNSQKLNYVRWYLTCVNDLHDRLSPAQTMFTRAIECYRQFGFSQDDILTHIVYASCYMSAWDSREKSRTVTLRQRCVSFICFLYLAQAYLQDKCISLKRWRSEIHPSDSFKSLNNEVFLLQKEREFILRVPQSEFEARLEKFELR